MTFKNVAQKNLDGQSVVVWMRNVSYSLGHSKTAGSQAEEAEPCRRKYAIGASFESLRPLPTSVCSPGLVLVVQDMTSQLPFLSLPAAVPPSLDGARLLAWNHKPK